MEKTPGQIAFEADPLTHLPWEALTDEERGRWEDSANLGIPQPPPDPVPPER